MTTVENGAIPSLSFPTDNRVRITDLQTRHDDLSSLNIAAQVVLIWPYSNSTRKFSLLLSETDVRPLKGRKQVKVTFLNGAARAAQQSKVGIGDGIRIQLEGCQWAQTDDVISTPGKRIDGDIQFRKSLAFEIVRSSGPPQQVQYQATGTPSPVASPAVNGVLEITQDLQIAPSKIAIPYSTPAVRKANRLSSTSYFDSPLDPFAEDKEFVYGRSSKRTKFARPSGDWKLVDDEDEADLVEVETPLKDRGLEPSQQTEQVATNPEIAEASNIPDVESVPEISHIPDVRAVPEVKAVPEVIDFVSPIEEPSQIAPLSLQAEGPSSWSPEPLQAALYEPAPAPATFMKPPETPAKPQRREKPKRTELDDHAEDSDATSTPRLMPLASPGLPLVSPLIRRSGVEFGYFPPTEYGVSDLDAIGKPEEEDLERRRSPTPTSSKDSATDDSLVMLDEPPKKPEAPIPSSAIGPHVVEDDDMYGPSQPPHPLDEPQKPSPQRSRDALDVLEEFLQISPTVPDEPYHAENEEELEVLDGIEAKPEQHLQTASESSLREPAISEAQSEQSTSEPATPDAALFEAVISEPELDEAEILQGEVEEPESSPVESQSVNSEVVDEAEIVPAQVEEPVSPVRAQSARSEDAEEMRRPPSRTLSLDGTMDEDDDESLEQVALLQNVTHEPPSRDRQETHKPLSDVTRQIHVERQPAFDEAAQTLRDIRIQFPPTPTHTQDQPVASEVPQVQAKDLSLLPTPDNTQEPEQPSPSQVVPATETVTEETEEAMLPSEDAAEPQQPLRASQRLTRRSVASDNISSPYFTARKPQRAIRSSPVREEPLPSARDGSPPPSSPPVEPPSSPTRPVTRSQRDTSKMPFVSVTGDQLEDLEASPSSPAEPVQDLQPKTGISTSGSYYPPLASLNKHFSQTVDIIALAIDDSATPERAKSGPRDYYTILHLIDPSLDSASKTRTTAQIFRPARQALPTARRGDVLVLRNFRVQTVKHKWILLSTESSAWAVFSVNPKTRSMFGDVTMSGPPVEYAAGERLQVKKLVQWWQSEGESFPASGKKPSVEIPPQHGGASGTKATTEPHKQNGELSRSTDSTDAVSFEKEPEVIETIEPPPLSPRRTRRRNNMTDNFGNEDDAPLPSAAAERDTATPTAVRHQPARRAKSKTPAVNGTNDVSAGASAEKGSPLGKRGPTPHKRGPSLVHELRDGTKYVDDGREHAGGVVHELRDGRNYVDE